MIYTELTDHMPLILLMIPVGVLIGIFVGVVVFPQLKETNGLKKFLLKHEFNRSSVALCTGMLTWSLIIFVIMITVVVPYDWSAKAAVQTQTQAEEVYGIELTETQAKELNDGYVPPTTEVVDEDFIFGETTVTIDGDKVNLKLVKENNVFKLIDDDASSDAELPKREK